MDWPGLWPSSPLPAALGALAGEGRSGFFARHPALTATLACLLVPPASLLYRYRASIRERIEEIERTVGRVVRNRDAGGRSRRRVVCMELDPSFVEANPAWRMTSLGGYLSQLEPADVRSGFNKLFLQRELEVAIGGFLLRTLGDTYGSAILPLLGAGSVAGSIAGVSSRASAFVARCILSDDDDGEEKTEDGVSDPMSFDLSLMELVGAVRVWTRVWTSNC